MGISRMVANSVAYRNRLPDFTFSSDSICQEFVRRSGTMKESKLAVFGCKSGLISKLLVRARMLGLSVLPSTVDALVFCIVWLDLIQSFSSCADVLAAVSREHLKHQLPDPTKEYRVKRVYKALLKEYKKEKDPEWP
ncbi:6299_t:CDS:2 [Cetraspora pellucida]|uniref:6299_t:CDS:1 n=1 Tax=Cetraspora pellucida TaxID=1433469 RepID=A0A9N9HEP3_9GLOM|nr:6299_t:CDS:2 [Cetraspora pellucida]